MCFTGDLVVAGGEVRVVSPFWGTRWADRATESDDLIERPAESLCRASALDRGCSPIPVALHNEEFATEISRPPPIGQAG